jgi:hypothetical protein|tara:strand:- start:255 stop:1019 length:765 start_codon:yes stop_codon:yes gene_type:complete
MGLTNKQAFKRDELEVELSHELAHAGPKKRLAVSIQDALAVACAALRINGSYIKDTRRFSCEENKTQFANKELVKYAFSDQTDYLPDDYVRLVPTEEDYTQVAEIQQWMKRYVMLGLGDLDDFKKDMVATVSQDTVRVSNLGRVAYIPEFVRRDKHESGLKKEIRVEYRDSKHLGKEKDTVEGVAKILDVRYSPNWESYNYTAVIDGNLISFMNKYKHEQGTMKRIKAKVKALTENRLFGACETRLNYVKLFKV